MRMCVCVFASVTQFASIAHRPGWFGNSWMIMEAKWLNEKRRHILCAAKIWVCHIVNIYTRELWQAGGGRWLLPVGVVGVCVCVVNKLNGIYGQRVIWIAQLTGNGEYRDSRVCTSNVNDGFLYILILLGNVKGNYGWYRKQNAHVSYCRFEWLIMMMDLYMYNALFTINLYMFIQCFWAD